MTNEGGTFVAAKLFRGDFIPSRLAANEIRGYRNFVIRHLGFFSSFVIRNSSLGKRGM